MASRPDDEIKALWKKFLYASFAWLALGVLSGLFMALQRLWPSSLESVFWLRVGRLHVYNGSFLIFGWGIQFLLAMWIFRLRQLRGESLRFISLWEFGLICWNYTLSAAFLACFFGYHNDLPVLNWPVEFYLMLLASMGLFIGAIVSNISNDYRFEKSPALLFLLCGLGGLFVLIFAFLVSSAKLMFFISSINQMLIIFGLLFPTLGLLLPLPKTKDVERFPFFFWGLILTLPISTAVFSGSLKDLGFAVLVHVILFVLLSASFSFLWDYWEVPERYFARFFPWSIDEKGRWSENLQELSHADEFEGADESEKMESVRKETAGSVLQVRKAYLRHFFLAGAIVFLFSLLESFGFGFLRLFGLQPYPTWQNSHTYLLLFGCLFLWWQGLSLLFFKSDMDWPIRDIRVQFWAAIMGIALFVLGSWLETLFMFRLEQLGLPRGHTYSSIARSLQLLGYLSTVVAFVFFLKPFSFLLSRKKLHRISA